MPRFYLPPSEWTEAPVLQGPEAQHLAQVLRIQEGQWITVFDGIGSQAEAKVLSVTKSKVDLMLEIAESQDPIYPAITLAQAIPKGKNMDWIIQKSVELGVATIVPLITEHTISAPGDNKVEKWRRTALEACKQCGQNYLPNILEPVSYARWIEDHAPAQLNLIASLIEHAVDFRKTLESHSATGSITILIGPEGDFSPAESDSALKKNFLPISLGALVLRVETATLFALSAIRYHFSEADNPQDT